MAWIVCALDVLNSSDTSSPPVGKASAAYMVKMQPKIRKTGEKKNRLSKNPEKESFLFINSFLFPRFKQDLGSAAILLHSSVRLDNFKLRLDQNTHIQYGQLELKVYSTIDNHFRKKAIVHHITKMGLQIRRVKTGTAIVSILVQK